tara:strand:+ start:9642 stop:11093 length:1452 start_codon:yes stop_codon:yes gene_type:complete
LKISLALLITLLIYSSNSFSLPIDWQGEITFDHHYLSNARFIQETGNGTGNIGSTEVLKNGFNENEASFQSYIFKLSPTIIVSDSVILKGEISNGLARGGRLGDDSANNFGTETNPGRYYNNTPAGTNQLNLNQLYARIYGTTATYEIGRHPIHWGLGALVNNGSESQSRFSTIRDGITAKVKLGKFSIEPFIARSFSSDSLSSESNQSEIGGTLLFNSIESEMKLGVYYSSITTGENESQRRADTNNTGSTTPFNEGKIKVTDFYFEKSYKNINLKIEVPILSGTIGNVFQNSQSSNIDSKGMIAQLVYTHNDQWLLKSTIGNVNGEDGTAGSFEGLSLHPNFQVSNIMFNYNRAAVWDTNENIFDSSITNSTFLDLDLIHKSNQSTWILGFTYAVANEAAKAGSSAYNHLTGKTFSAAFDQDESLGLEVDLDYEYQLSEETLIDLSLAYFSPGDFYAYTNTATVVTPESSYLFKFGTTIRF